MVIHFEFQTKIGQKNSATFKTVHFDIAVSFTSKNICKKQEKLKDPFPFFHFFLFNTHLKYISSDKFLPAYFLIFFKILQ